MGSSQERGRVAAEMYARPEFPSTGAGAASRHTHQRFSSRDQRERLAKSVGIRGYTAPDLQIVEEQPEVFVPQAVPAGDEAQGQFEMVRHV
jgi:hypothetical protein